MALIDCQIPDWQVTTLGDDIVWLRPGDDGKLYGMNPETGFFGVAPNTSWKTNPNGMRTIAKNTIFTNVALTSNGDVWWEGLSDEVPQGLIDWTGKSYNGSGLAAHPNSRFTVSVQECPILSQTEKNRSSASWVPISAILFGGKRKDVIPLVREALDWQHGVYMGATICSEQTAAAEGPQGVLRYDPFAMLPFCGYNIGKYFQHWLNLGSKLTSPPKFYYVNWFRKDTTGKFLWPGFSHNLKVLAWIHHRCHNDTNDNDVHTSIGIFPQHITDLNNNPAHPDLFTIDEAEWQQQLKRDYDYLVSLQQYVPVTLFEENTRMQRKTTECIKTL